MGRTLIYIPIIHTDPDLGSLASDVEEKATRLLGERWKKHKRTVEEYWREITMFFEKREMKGVKIFQDGLPAGGKIAQRIINKLAKTGSPNYQLLKELSQAGAEVLKTEDPALLKQEYRLTKELVAQKSLLGSVVAFLRYRLLKNRLLKARDDYIANQINQSLKEGETGICFLGAYHQVLPKLSKDIKIIQVKRYKKVRQYYQALAGSKKAGVINGLARYLTRPLKTPEAKTPRMVAG